MEPMTLAIGVIAGIVGGKAVKELVVKFIPATAPFFATFDVVQKQLLDVINVSSEALNKNEDLKHWAEEQAKKAAAKLIK